jgi:hypothetical protein
MTLFLQPSDWPGVFFWLFIFIYHIIIIFGKKRSEGTLQFRCGLYNKAYIATLEIVQRIIAQCQSAMEQVHHTNSGETIMRLATNVSIF